MSEYCYVIVNNAGQSWPALSSVDGQPPRDQPPTILPQLLTEGWVPIRETAMGGGSSPLAHSLILLERPAKAKSTKGVRAAK
jgi:hypothetical protein